MIVGIGREVIGKVKKGKGVKAVRISRNIRKAMSERASKKKIWVKRVNRG